MLVDDTVLRVIEPVTGLIHAEHTLVAPGEVSIDDTHYDKPRPDKPSRAARPRTQQDKDFLALDLAAAHGDDAVLTALQRAVEFGRWRGGDSRSILATHGQAPTPRPAGEPLVLTLPSVPTRSLDAYKIPGNIEGGESS